MGDATCRAEVLDAMRRLRIRTGREDFALREIVAEVRTWTTRYPESTIGTHVVSAMCASAPVHHANHTNDLERVGRGRYRLASDSPSVTPPLVAAVSVDAELADPASSADADATIPWYWEGEVQTAIASWLATEGWIIQRSADTLSRESGVDILATRGDELLCIEVKGYPASRYARGENAGRSKPTAPATQARAYFSGALLSALLLIEKYPRAAIAIGLPEFTTYTNLLVRTRASLERLGVGVVVASEDGCTWWLQPAGAMARESNGSGAE